MLKRMDAPLLEGKELFALLALIAFLAAFIAGCGGGGSTVTPPIPNPEVHRSMEVRIIAHNPVTSNELDVTGADVTIATGTVSYSGTTGATGSVLFPNIPEDTYHITVSNGTSVNQRFVTDLSQSFSLTSEAATATVMVIPTFNVVVEVKNMANDLEKVSGAIVALASENNFATTTLTTPVNGQVVFTDIPADVGYRTSVTNLGETIPKIGADTVPQFFVIAAGYTIENPITISGLVPECWDDSDPTQCSTPDPGDATLSCLNPGIGGSTGLDPARCQWIANRY